MRKYELMIIFPIEDDLFKEGLEKVQAVLKEFGAEIESEESYGNRELMYEVKKRTHGRYQLLHIQASPAKIVDIDQKFKLNNNILKCMFVKKEDE
ncbi:MAG TPA: 30S ribosomal protein S6 [Treponemataceae bacterium]|nr:30S ribosomal protein S6 [Treponemataceae bacterium]